MTAIVTGRAVAMRRADGTVVMTAMTIVGGGTVTMVSSGAVSVVDGGAVSVVMSGSHSRAVDVTAGVVTGMHAVVATPVRQEHCGTRSVIERPVGIAVVDVEHPCSGVPRHGAVEIVEAEEPVVLPGGEYMAKVSVAAVPPRSVDIVAAVHAHEVVEVDFVDSLILCLGEVELVRHFIGKEEGFGARLVVCHCCGRDGYRHHHCQDHHLLHDCIFLKVILTLFLISGAKIGQKYWRRKGISLKSGEESPTVA